MEQLVVTTDAKPLWSPIWTPTRNDVFWYQKVIAPGTRAIKIENFQLKKIIEDLAKILEKAAFKIDGNDYLSTMIFCGEHNSR